MGNTRRRKRFRKRCETEFTANGVVRRGISTDLSLQGLFIKTSSPFPPDTILNLVLHLNDGLTSTLQVKVKRVENATEATTHGSRRGMGVEIIKKDTHYIRFISSLLVHYEVDDNSV
jgi:hypothetical protein